MTLNEFHYINMFWFHMIPIDNIVSVLNKTVKNKYERIRMSRSIFTEMIFVVFESLIKWSQIDLKELNGDVENTTIRHQPNNRKHQLDDAYRFAYDVWHQTFEIWKGRGWNWKDNIRSGVNKSLFNSYKCSDHTMA